MQHHSGNLDIHTSTAWQRCLQQLAKEIPKQQFSTWIEPLTVEFSQEKNKLYLQVSNRFKLDWLRSQYAAILQKTVHTVFGEDVGVEFGLPLKKTNNEGNHNQSETESEKSEHSIYKIKKSNTARTITKNTSHLNAGYNFNTLVEGSANRMARTAALHIAADIGKNYNPLFVYGGVGLGKTHLIHAIGNQLLRENPNAKVLYIHAERFVSDVVKAYQHRTFDTFKGFYHNLDLLLIDDIQFFANKERSQEEFFNAFEALLAKKSHIVLTSDTYPKGIINIHERLASRFDSGLTVAIEPPELEMRVVILVKKAAQEGVKIPEDVAFFVAKNVRSNVRELEGALRKILAFSRFNNKDITVSLAKESLRDLLLIQNQQISVESIQKAVADFYKIKVIDMYSKKRPSNIAKPRQIAMYLAKELTQKSLPEIGELFGGRDHTTILHAVRKVNAERKQLSTLNQQINVLEQTLKGQ